MAYVDVALLGWMPDADPTVPGVVTDCDSVVPTLRGLKAERSLTTWGVSAVPSTCMGIGTDMRVGQVETPIVGTKANLYRSDPYAGNVWVDVTGSTCSSLGSPAGARWRFDSVGKVNLAINYYNVLRQQTTAMTAFTVVTGAPSGDLIAVASNFVMVANTEFVAMGFQYEDAWWCSALGDYTDWTPSVATQAAYGRLLDTPGRITSLTAFGRDIVAMKRSGMWVGRYVGPPVIWDWVLLHSDIGSYFQGSVVVANDVMYWWGEQGCFMFDGSRARPVPNAPVDWARNLYVSSGGEFGSVALMPYTQGVYSPKERLIRWYFMSSLNLWDLQIAYHIDSGRWGKNDSKSDDGVACEAIGRYASYWADAPFVVRTGTHIPMQYDGTAGTASITTHEIGSMDTVTTLRSLRPKWLDAPDSATATHYAHDDLGVSAAIVDSSIGIADGKFDLKGQSRWHRVRIDTHGAMEVVGFSVDVEPGGPR